MLWARVIAICFFSFTSISLFLFQGIEFVKAFSEYFHNK
ncbi:hypothetical protein BACCIP111883_02406 [Sutcliffiella rhizosphaerae]|uniref:Uncharacterized protein n=1 Tax=Sutcliffiella rhizosphaerae TaxID=2880967 RepID=A0ABM8YP18_9BACI|nr:hypothetical protein BACCIP111883_02406 [Sutcliffiella rhizosphaerae]